MAGEGGILTLWFGSRRERVTIPSDVLFCLDHVPPDV